jgi:hypothetical protein
MVKWLLRMQQHHNMGQALMAGKVHVTMGKHVHFFGPRTVRVCLRACECVDAVTMSVPAPIVGDHVWTAVDTPFFDRLFLTCVCVFREKGTCRTLQGDM